MTLTMCGIAGMFSLGPALTDADRAEIGRMLAVQAHRGPDADGIWQGPGVVFGHRRLAIFDAGHHADQPMATADGQGAIVFNGAVYNFLELRAELEREGLAFRTRSDTEVVLAALHRWGPEAAVARFNGMFALAYYDGRSGELWLLRDRLGIKPLSVAVLAGRLVFASEDKALLGCRGVDRRIDSREITLRLALEARDAAASLFTGIERLPPAALWRVADGRVERRTYWHALDALDFDRMLAKGDAGALQTQLDELLGRSVELHCRADTTLATACSAGVDSGLVTAYSRAWRPGFNAYVVDLLVGSSEAPDAERTASRLGVPIRRVTLSQSDYLASWPRAIHHLESGGWHTSDVAMLALTARCRADGVKVLLTGEGADELFGGYRWHAASAERWRPLGWPRRLLLSRGARHRLERQFESAPFSRLYCSASREEQRIFSRSLSPGQHFLPQRIMQRLAPVRSPSERAFVGNGLYDLYTHLQNILYRHDRLSMAVGVELRVPFLENGLIDFALSLPPGVRYRKGQDKWLVKQIAADHLPAANVWAKKRGFPVDPGYTTGTQGLLRGGLLADAMRWSAAENEDIVDLAARDGLTRFHLVGMEMFLRLYAGGVSVDALIESLNAARHGQ